MDQYKINQQNNRLPAGQSSEEARLQPGSAGSPQYHKDSYTQIMRGVYRSISQTFHAIHTRRDVLMQAQKLQNKSLPAKKDAAVVLLAILSQAGVEVPAFDDVQKLAAFVLQPEILAQFPTENELQENMFLTLAEQYRNFPAPQDFMLRMADRFGNPKWKHLPLRVRILRQFVQYGQGMKAIHPISGKSVYICNGYPAIRKWIRSKGQSVPASPEKTAALIEEDVFSLLDTASAEQLKPNGTFGLIKMADDLAKGRFLTGKATKKALYLLGMVYGMDYSSDRSVLEETAGSHSRDVEKNLFFDFYNNNLIRFLQEEYRTNPGNFETLPSGQGINYKNFAEAVYLYYFARKELSPSQKLQGSYAMITRLKERADKNQSGQHPQQEGLHSADLSAETMYYQRLFIPDTWGDSLLSRDEEGFESFLFDHYDCSTMQSTVKEEPKKSGQKKKEGQEVRYRVSDLDVSTGQNSAYTLYCDLLEDFRQSGLEESAWRSGLWIGDYLEEDSRPLQDLCRRHPELNAQAIAEFAEFMKIANRYLKEDAFKVQDASQMSRTALLSAAYHHFLYCEERNVESTFPSFESMFVPYMDSYLEEAGYQPLSPKSLLDTAVVFSAYLGQ